MQAKLDSLQPTSPNPARMNGMKKLIAALFVLVLACSPLMAASWVGKLTGKVLDPDGNPVEGVTISVTSPNIPEFGDSDSSDKRGRFRLEFPRKGVAYDLVFEKEGFTTYRHRLNWNVEGAVSEEFTLEPGAALAGGPPPASLSNDAIQAYNDGVKAYTDGDWELAGTKFALAIEHDPKLHQAWTALAMTRQNQDRFQESAEAAETAIGLGSTDPLVFRTRWEAYRDLGDEEKAAEALASFQDATLRTEEAKKLHNQAIGLRDEGDMEGAFEAFREAASLDPALKPALLGVATAGVELGRMAEVADAAEALLAIDPGNEHGIRLRYNACLELGDDARLFDAMLGLVAVEPEAAKKGMLSVAFDSYDSGKMELAETRFDKLLELDPDQPLAHYYLGLVKMSIRTPAEAKPHLERVLQLLPDSRESAVAAELLKSME